LPDMCWIIWEQEACKNCGVSVGSSYRIGGTECGRKLDTNHKAGGDIKIIRIAECARCQRERRKSNKEGKIGGKEGAYLSFYPW